VGKIGVAAAGIGLVAIIFEASSDSTSTPGHH
jgi:hypothetical protein